MMPKKVPYLKEKQIGFDTPIDIYTLDWTNWIIQKHGSLEFQELKL